MKKQLIIVFSIALIAISGYWYFATETNPKENGHVEPEIMNPVFGARPAGTRIIIKNQLLSPGSQKLSFELYGKDGHPFGDKDIEIAHEKKIHLIIVSDDFTSYQHVHPSYATGAWETDVEFKNDTAYQAYFDVDPIEEEPQVLRVPLRVGTPTAKSKVSQEKNTISIDGVTASLAANQPVMSGDPLAFSVTRSGMPLIAEPYLGEQGHVVAISHTNPDNFVHVHPLAHEGKDTDIDFSIEVPVSGTYTLFAQFKTGGAVLMFPFTIDVTRNGTTEPQSMQDETHE